MGMITFFYKYRFNKKLKNDLHGGVNEFLNILLHTDENDWIYSDAYDDDRISFMFYENTKIVFYKNDLFIRVGNTSFANVELNGRELEFYFSDFFENADETLLRQTMYFLNNLLKLVTQQYELKEKEEEEFARMKEIQGKEALENKINAHASELQTLVSAISKKKSGQEWSSPHFTIVFRKTRIYEVLTIAYEGNDVFVAFYHSKTGSINTESLISNKTDEAILELAKKKIMKSICSFFTTNEPLQNIVHSGKPNEFAQFYSMIEHLTEDVIWLDQESAHRLTHTLPKDLTDLQETFLTLQNKSAMTADINESFEHIHNMLQTISERIEQNKQLKMKQKIEVIKRR